MLLAIDIGNTNTVFALIAHGKITSTWRMTTVHNRTSDEYASFYRNLIKDEAKNIEAVIISSVVPETKFHISKFCLEHINADPVFVTKDNIDIKIDIERPEDVGSDRLVNAIGVLKHHKTPAIVLDYGTATTFDIIDDQGAYCGGIIAPGINLSLSALSQAASKLPKISIEKPPSVIGKTTINAMQSGSYWGYVSLINGLLKKLLAEPAMQNASIIATGGLAETFRNDLDYIQTIDQDLTLKGLYKIYCDIKEHE